MTLSEQVRELEERAETVEACEMRAKAWECECIRLQSWNKRYKADFYLMLLVALIGWCFFFLAPLFER